MTQDVGLFTGSIPEVYQRALVPLLFEPYAVRLAALAAGLPAARLPSHDVLEVAAGTGVLSRALAGALPESQIVATDLAPGMLEQARAWGVAPNLRYEQADATALPYADASFDLVVAQFGVMFLPDKRAGFAEAARVLRPDAELAFLTWKSLDHNPLPALVMDAINAMFPDNPSSFMQRLPHGYFDRDVIRADVASAGLRVDTLGPLTAVGHAASARQVAEGFCLGTPVRAEIEARDPDRLADVVDAVERAVAGELGDGPVHTELAAILVTATKTASGIR